MCTFPLRLGDFYGWAGSDGARIPHCPSRCWRCPPPRPNAGWQNCWSITAHTDTHTHTKAVSSKEVWLGIPLDPYNGFNGGEGKFPGYYHFWQYLCLALEVAEVPAEVLFHPKVRPEWVLPHGAGGHAVVPKLMELLPLRVDPGLPRASCPKFRESFPPKPIVRQWVAGWKRLWGLQAERVEDSMDSMSILVVQRNNTRFFPTQGLIKELQGRLPGITVVSGMFEGMPIREQMALTNKHSVIFASHGSGETNFMGCRHGTQIIELCPPYAHCTCFPICPHVYRPLLDTFGVTMHAYGFARKTETCAEFCKKRPWNVGNRIYVRNQDIPIDVSEAADFVAKVARQRPPSPEIHVQYL